MGSGSSELDSQGAFVPTGLFVFLQYPVSEVHFRQVKEGRLSSGTCGLTCD